MMPWCAVTLPSFQARERWVRSSWPMIGAQRWVGLEQAVQDRGHFGEHAFGQVAPDPSAGTSWPCASRTGPGRSPRSPARPAQAAWNRPPASVPRSNSSGGPSRTRSVSTDTTWALPAARICCAACCATGCCRQRPASSVLAIGCHPLRGERLTACGQRHVDGPVTARTRRPRSLGRGPPRASASGSGHARPTARAVVAGLPPEHR